MSLQVKQLSGGYGQQNVLRQVSFEIGAGEVLALVGLNGSGKSTTINHLIGLLSPTSGSIQLNGVTLVDNPVAYKKQIAYIPEQPVIYPELTLEQHIQLMIDTYNLDNTMTWERAQELLDMFRLGQKEQWYPTHFSKGMRQKLMIVMAFMLDADLYIIDEPFLGLDVVAVDQLLTLMADKKAQGAKILVTTHMVEKLRDLADTFVYLDHGEVAASGAINQYVDPREGK